MTTRYKYKTRKKQVDLTYQSALPIGKSSCSPQSHPNLLVQSHQTLHVLASNVLSQGRWNWDTWVLNMCCHTCHTGVFFHMFHTPKLHFFIGKSANKQNILEVTCFPTNPHVQVGQVTMGIGPLLAIHPIMKIQWHAGYVSPYWSMTILQWPCTQVLTVAHMAMATQNWVCQPKRLVTASY